MNVKCLIGSVIVASAGLASVAAHAGGVSFGINVGVPAPVYAAPVYAAPAPVYAAPMYAPPPAVVYQPAPVVVAPAPAIVVGWHGGRYWDGARYWNRGDYYAHHGGYGYHRW